MPGALRPSLHLRWSTASTRRVRPERRRCSSASASSTTTRTFRLPAGTAVPAGDYDRERGMWVPTDDGRVFSLDVAGGIAARRGARIARDPALLAALGFTDAGAPRWRRSSPGATLWRSMSTFRRRTEPAGRASEPTTSTSDPLPDDKPDDPCKRRRPSSAATIRRSGSAWVAARRSRSTTPATVPAARGQHPGRAGERGDGAASSFASSSRSPSRGGGSRRRFPHSRTRRRTSNGTGSTPTGAACRADRERAAR
jgi:hypothetical protein